MKFSNPLVTVLMPVYNGEKYLSQAVESILNQTFRNFEFLIIDDCSNDQSINIIKSFKDDRIQLEKNKRNIGQTLTLNKGLSLAKGEFIARLDQDDISNYNRLELQTDYLKKYPDVVLLGSSIKIINSDNQVMFKRKAFKDKLISYSSIDNPVPHSSAIYRKDIALQLNGYSKDYKICQDFDLWLRMANNDNIDNLDEYLVSVRFHKGQTLKNKNISELHSVEIVNVYNYLINNFKIPNYSRNLVNIKLLLYDKSISRNQIILYIIKNIHNIIFNKYYWIKLKFNFQQWFHSKYNHL